MAETQNPNIVPVGPGGIPGRIARICVFFASGGFLYPNVFIEGMDPTRTQEGYAGTLYDKK